MTRCWPYTGYLMPNGYGQVRVKGKRMLVHRAAYEALIGPIPTGLDLHHLCRNRACYNPAHLEPVPRAENLRRGRAVPVVPTHCPKGHLYDYPPRSGRHRCLACKRIDARRRREVR